MQITPVRTTLFKEGDDLAAFVMAHVPEITEGTIVVLASKIVALAEGRTMVSKSGRALAALIRQESDAARKTKYVWFTRKDKMIMANAGIDESNADGKLVLLPQDAYRSARTLRSALTKHYGLKKCGILISDSCPLPLRAGVAGFALGYAGFSGLREYRGKKDLFGRELRMTRTNLADGIAASAGVVMGEGAERQPLVLVTGAPVSFVKDVPPGEISIPLREDMYYPLFKNAGL